MDARTRTSITAGEQRRTDRTLPDLPKGRLPRDWTELLPAVLTDSETADAAAAPPPAAGRRRRAGNRAGFRRDRVSAAWQDGTARGATDAAQ